jgi:hypothetical protein
MSKRIVQTVQSQPEADQPLAELLHASFNRYAPFKPPPLFLPRDAGEDEGGV